MGYIFSSRPFLEILNVKPDAMIGVLSQSRGRFVMNRNILFVPIRILSILLLFYIPICSAEFNWKPDYISIGLGELNSTSPSLPSEGITLDPGTTYVPVDHPLGSHLLSPLDPSQKHRPADDSSFTLGLGFNVNENFSLEIAYSDLGSSVEVHQFRNVFGGDPDPPPYRSTYYNHSSFQINSLTKTKLNNNIDLYLKLGIGRTNISKKTSNTPLSIYSDPKENIELIYGVGSSYDLMNKLKVFVEFIDNGHDSIKSGYSAGIKYSF